MRCLRVLKHDLVTVINKSQLRNSRILDPNLSFQWYNKLVYQIFFFRHIKTNSLVFLVDKFVINQSIEQLYSLWDVCVVSSVAADLNLGLVI